MRDALSRAVSFRPAIVQRSRHLYGCHTEQLTPNHCRNMWKYWIRDKRSLTESFLIGKGVRGHDKKIIIKMF